MKFNEYYIIHEKSEKEGLTGDIKSYIDSKLDSIEKKLQAIGSDIGERSDDTGRYNVIPALNSVVSDIDAPVEREMSSSPLP